eukprot:1775669-Karenia_brevis.AAC.1
MSSSSLTNLLVERVAVQPVYSDTDSEVSLPVVTSILARTLVTSLYINISRRANVSNTLVLEDRSQGSPIANETDAINQETPPRLIQVRMTPPNAPAYWSWNGSESSVSWSSSPSPRPSPPQ